MNQRDRNQARPVRVERQVLSCCPSSVAKRGNRNRRPARGRVSNRWWSLSAGGLNVENELAARLVWRGGYRSGYVRGTAVIGTGALPVRVLPCGAVNGGLGVHGAERRTRARRR